LRSISVEEDTSRKLRNGMPVSCLNTKYEHGEIVVVLSKGGELIGMAEIDQEIIKPKKIVPGFIV